MVNNASDVKQTGLSCAGNCLLFQKSMLSKHADKILSAAPVLIASLSPTILAATWAGSGLPCTHQY